MKKKLHDWSRKRIRGELLIKGSSLADVEREEGYARGSASMLWQQMIPRLQEAIARKIGVAPWIIWPTRYDSKCRPRVGRLIKSPNTSAGKKQCQDVA